MIDKFFSGMPNIFIIAGDVLVTGFDRLGRDYDVIIEKVQRLCRKATLNLNKDKCLFRCSSIPFFSEIISQQGVSPANGKVQALTDMLPPKFKICSHS